MIPAIVCSSLFLAGVLFCLFQAFTMRQGSSIWWRWLYRPWCWIAQHALGGWRERALPDKLYNLSYARSFIDRARYREDPMRGALDYAQSPERSWELLNNPEVRLGDCDDSARLWCALARLCHEVLDAEWACFWAPGLAHATCVVRKDDGMWYALDYDREWGPCASKYAAVQLCAYMYLGRGHAGVEACVFLDAEARALEVIG